MGGKEKRRCEGGKVPRGWWGNLGVEGWGLVRGERSDGEG